jgi:hypothetical protein
MNMDAYSRSEKESHLHTIHYEIAMLNFCGLQLDTLSPDTQKAHFNAFLECFLIHYRNLVEFLSGNHHRPAKKPGDTSDLSTADPTPWAGRGLSAPELAQLQLPAKELDERYFLDISQYLQHCTERRFSEDKFWSYRTMYSELRPIIEAFLKLFPRNTTAKQRPSVITNGSGTATFQILEWKF